MVKSIRFSRVGEVFEICEVFVKDFGDICNIINYYYKFREELGFIAIVWIIIYFKFMSGDFGGNFVLNDVKKCKICRGRRLILV